MEVGVYHEFHCRPDQAPAEAFDEALAQIEAADRWGLDAIWLAEIHQQPRRSVLTAPLTIASAIAARTRRIKIGTGVQVLPLCHPLRLAEETATIDQISKGRLLFGVGRSGNPRSYVAYGVPYSESRERFLETLEIVKRAWTQPSFAYDGKYYSFNNASAVPRPYQQPHPPIRVAAASEETFPSLGEAGYPIFVAVRSGSLSGLAPDLAAYRRAYKEAGHPGEGEVYLRLTLHIAPTDRQARDEAEESIMSGYRTLSTRLENSPNRRRAAEAQIVKTISYEEVMRDKVIIGSPEFVADRLQQLHEELGLDGILAELNFGALISARTNDTLTAVVVRTGHASFSLSAAHAMKRSTERFLTTHTGSLPRPEDLVRSMFAREEGVPVDPMALKARIRSAVAAVVEKQAEAGIDIVNDGEVSKPSYATYIKDRLNGFGGDSHPLVYQDLVDFPELARRVFGDPGRSRRKTPGCDSEINVRDPAAAETDVDNLKAALIRVNVQEAFLSAASPGVISLFFHNSHYPSEEAYLYAIAEAIRHEYETIANAGFILQIDCPDLAMGRHIQYAALSVTEFCTKARLHIEALNHALANIPADRLRLHLCWGNYEGPHHYDVPLRGIIETVFLAKPSGLSFEAANPRHAHEWTVFEHVKLPEGKVLIPGVIELKTNFIEHPALIAQRIGRFAKLVGRENVIAGSDCGYGTWVGQAAVDPGVVWAKLASLAEGARLATREFWP